MYVTRCWRSNGVEVSTSETPCISQLTPKSDLLILHNTPKAHPRRTVESVFDEECVSRRQRSNSDDNPSRPPLSPFTSYPRSKNTLHGCVDAKTMKFRCYVKIASLHTSLGMVVNFARHIIFRWRGPTLDAELRIHITHRHCQGIASQFILSRRV
jgi:hypothetical protein